MNQAIYNVEALRTINAHVKDVLHHSMKNFYILPPLFFYPTLEHINFFLQRYIAPFMVPCPKEDLDSARLEIKQTCQIMNLYFKSLTVTKRDDQVLAATGSTAIVLISRAFCIAYSFINSKSITIFNPPKTEEEDRIFSKVLDNLTLYLKHFMNFEIELVKQIPALRQIQLAHYNERYQSEVKRYAPDAAPFFLEKETG